MRRIAFCLVAVATAGSIIAQQANLPSGTTRRSVPDDTPNLPVQKLGIDDLVGVSVYDASELSRSYRIDAEGNIHLPMVRQRVRAAGLLPSELEDAIASALVDEHIMVNPVVTVSVVEYHSRPITIMGAVRSPVTFQATGTTTLLDALSRAGGIADNAGAEILVSRPAQNNAPNGPPAELTQRIAIRPLLEGTDQASNIKLQGGETIRVPDAGRVYIIGNVKRPGPYPIGDGSEGGILKAMSYAGGLDSFAAHIAYIYRINDATGRKDEIPVNISRILARKAPDVPLYADDTLYIPNRAGLRASAKTLELGVGIGLAVTTILVYILR